MKLKNNITKITTKDVKGKVIDSESYNITYEYNANNFPTKQTHVSFDN